MVTDGSNVLGDQGIGGMAIVQAKIDIYVASGAYNPRNVMPVFFDVGTNN